MRSFRYMAVLAAAACLCGAVSCGNKNSSSTSSQADVPLITAATVPVTTAESGSQPSTSAEEGEETIKKKVMDSKASSEPLTYGKLSEKHTPSEGDEEFNLGEYYESPDGVKLYFDPEKLPPELAMTMEKYFRSYAEADYETYTRCLYPSYIEEMNKFLQKEYSYDLRTSFANQCSSLRKKAGGEFRVTRVKLENGTNDLSKFFEYPSSCFGKDYYEAIKDEVDKFYHAEFFIMAESGGSEQLLVGEYEIVFAVKDGRYYTFG